MRKFGGFTPVFWQVNLKNGSFENSKYLRLFIYSKSNTDNELNDNSVIVMDTVSFDLHKWIDPFWAKTYKNRSKPKLLWLWNAENYLNKHNYAFNILMCVHSFHENLKTS